jgi:hypothetical protein
MVKLFNFKAFKLNLLIILSLSAYALSAQTGENAYQQVSSFENYIHSKCKEVVENGKTTENLTESDLKADLPVGIARQVGNSSYVIAIDSAYRADRGGWFFSAYASITFPGTTKPLAFAAKNIAFNNGGLTTSSQVRLILVSTKQIPVNENLTIELPADGRNFLEFDCKGFKSVNLKGNFIFSGGLLVPDPEVARGATQVTAAFEINTGDLSNIMTTVNITPFKINGLNDLSFEVRNAVMDYSDLINPVGFTLPQDYQQTYGESINLWRGFYLQEVAVRIKGFTDSTSVGKDPSIQARNLILDDLGVSGVFSATNLLSLQNGSADGWPFSVDQLSVKLLFNQVTGGSLAGFLSIPLLGDEPVAYTAMVEQDRVRKQMNYRFSVATGEDKEFPTPFAAKIKIAKGSVISLEKQGNGKLIPSALLHGSLFVQSGEMKVDKLRFENLGLTTQKPYIVSGIFSTVGSSQPKSMNFPIRIDSVNLRVYQGQAAIGFAVALNFMNKEDKGFGASTFIQILAKLEETQAGSTNADTPLPPSKKQQWKFDKIRISDIALDCRTQAFTLNGKLSIYKDDPVYGDGFHGSLKFSIKKVLEQGVKVNAYFGSMDTYRYWHVDAYVPVGNIPIIPPVSLTGIMGGASYKMSRKQPLVPDFSNLSKEAAANLSTGSANNDLVYIPDDKVALSFLAGVTLVIGNEKAANADVMLEVAFNQSGGIKYAQFNGSVFFMTAVESRGRVSGGKTPAAPVFASMNMLYDNDNDVFHANMKTYINMAGVVQGIGPNGLVGEAVIHVDKKDWYVYIGRPSQMFGVSLAGIATSQTYFMVGTKIENLPQPPVEVREVFDNIDLRLMRDDLAAAGGKGIAAGVHFKAGVDSKDKLKPFYIVLVVGAGADIMLRNYGSAYCAGRDGRIGIDGWYASGQAYVFLKGKVGIKVKRKEFDIVSLGLAALLQAKLPNPSWLRGNLAGKYSVLGGLVKGKFHLKFTVGEECEIVQPGSEIDDIVVIADVKPDNAGTDVSVFTAPQASFNTAIDTEFTMMDFQDNLSSYRIKMDEMTLSQAGAKLPATLLWNQSKDVAMLKTSEILPQQSTLGVFVKIHWEKKSANGLWEVMKDQTGQTIYETKETSFTTGAAPAFIPDENVLYSYPVKNQYNLHVNESGSGYVKLNYGQAYLFQSNEGEQAWDFAARFKDNRGRISDMPLTYNVANATANFSFPSAFDKQTIYALTFVKKARVAGGIDKNVQRTTVTREGGEGNEVTTASNTLQGTIRQAVEKDIYKSAFRTSQYSTFSEKWTAIGMAGGQDLFDIATGNIAVIGKRSAALEAFDQFELTGQANNKPLVAVTASPNNAWFQGTISPLLYDLYPIDKDVTILWRDPNELGIKPLKGVKLTNNVSAFQLTDTEITTGVAGSKNASVLIGYYLSYYTFWDYSELLNKAASKYLNNWGARPEGVRRLLAATGYTDLLSGYYPVDISYTLPGNTTPSFSTQVSIKF